MSTIRRQWTPPGPVAAAFMNSGAFLQGLMGPIGSGKTSTIVNKILKLAAGQAPNPRDGVARTKWVAIRDTYRQLHKTTIPTWRAWVPAQMGEWAGGENDGPAVHHLGFNVLDPRTRKAKRVEADVHFLALGDRTIEDVTRGSEITGAWLNEADLVTADAVIHLPGRMRYPSKEDGGPTWSGILCDFNAPDIENWTYRVFVEGQVEEGIDAAFFRQPSGFDPAAENLANLPADYYRKASAGQPDWFVRRMIRNEWGYSRDGKPVYPDFADAVHVAAEPLRAIRSLPLYLGLDQGLTPAAAVFQVDSFGQCRVLDELCLDNCGAERFAHELMRLLGARHGDLRVECGWCDPAGNQRAAQATNEATWRGVVAAKTRIPIRLASTNALMPRIEAVRQLLTRTLDAGRPGLLVSPTCKVLRRGFNSHYRFKRVRAASGEGWQDEPDKTFESNVHDALQYGVLGHTGYGGLMRRAEEQRARSMAPAINDWDPLG